MKITHQNTRRLLPCLALIVAQAAMVSTFAADADEHRGQLSSGDYKFAKAAASGGAMEVNLGKIATTKGSNPAVQQFGQRMVTDHGKAGQDLGQIATRKGATLPTQPTPSQQREMDRLEKLSGAEFDKAYINLMVRDHKADEKEFKKASENAEDTDLKAFATTMVPIIQEHLRMAEALVPTVKHEVSLR